jgi:hypothetical protein
MREVIFLAVPLLHKHVALLSKPTAAPAFVCPAKAKRKIRSSRREYFVKGTLKKALPIKPIMKIAKALDAVFSRQGGLSVTGFRNTKIVKSEVSRQVWLVVAAENRARFGNICPLRESFTPPCVILAYRMILR